MSIEKFITDGERARLFPVLSESSKEGRATSIFLSCLLAVPDLAVSLFSTIGRRVGVRTRVEVYTEVGVAGSSKLRPDGLIVLRTGKSTWSALLEAKVGSSKLDQSQIEAYLDLAKLNKIDAVITISNQFVTNPQLNPVSVSKIKTRSVKLYHWSWMLVLTHCTLLLDNERIEDEDQSRILSEFIRFLTHPSAGVKGFESMPKCWEEVVNKFSSGEKLKKSDPLVSELLSAWLQEEKDICLILSRIIQDNVVPKLPRAAKKNANVRQKKDADNLCSEGVLQTTLSVPNAASPINVSIDLASRVIQVSMKIQAPGDRVRGTARINWLLRQLKSDGLVQKIEESEVKSIDIISLWSGRAGGVRVPFIDAQINPDVALDNDRSNVPTSFEIVMLNAVKAGRFKSRKGFVAELEATITEFYANVGQKLKAWQPSAPEIRSKNPSPEAVSTEKIQEHIEGR